MLNTQEIQGPFYMPFGAQPKTVRMLFAKTKLKDKELAQELGVHISVIASHRSGRLHMGSKMATRFANSLGVSTPAVLAASDYTRALRKANLLLQNGEIISLEEFCLDPRSWENREWKPGMK